MLQQQRTQTLNKMMARIVCYKSVARFRQNLNHLNMRKTFVHARMETKFVEVVLQITLPEAGAQNQIKR